MFESIKLSDLPAKGSGILRQSSSTRPTIWIVEENGVQAVVKDYSTNGFLFRNTAGRFLVWRESKAYRKLKNLQGIPTLYRVIDGLALVIEQIPGKTLKKAKTEMETSDRYFDALKHLVDNLHKRGIAHCDLKMSPNILVGQDGLPYIVDWGASISKEEFRFFPLNHVYWRFVLDDKLAVVKAKLRYAPDAVSPEERDQYNYRSKGERLIRAIRDRVREIFQKIV